MQDMPNTDIKKLLAQMELLNQNSQSANYSGFSQDAMGGGEGMVIPKSLQGALGNNYNNLQANNPTNVDSLNPLPPSSLNNIPTSLVGGFGEEPKGFAFDPTQDEASMAMALTNLNEDFANGDVDYDEYQQLYGEYNGDPKDMLGQQDQSGIELGAEEIMGFMNSLSSPNSLNTSAYNIGRFAGMEKGTQGRGLGLAGNIGDFTLGAARGILGGLGQAKANNNVQNYYDKRKNQSNLSKANPQYQNTNTTGGLILKDGGEILSKIYQQQNQNEDPRYKEGEYIEFEYGGEVKKGKIKKVVGGKIYL